MRIRLRPIGWKYKPLLLRLLSPFSESASVFYRGHYLVDQDFFRRAFTALSLNGIDGDYVEFGCYSGMTFSLAYQESRRAGKQCKLWAFDSFSGFPAQKGLQDDRAIESSMRMELDDFHSICKKSGIPPSAYEVVPGYYEVTLNSEVSTSNLPSNICMAYVDCVWYSSTLFVLKFLLPRFKHGMILAFDDYYCWSQTKMSGERNACLRLLKNNANWRLVPYIQYGWHGMSFMIESKALNDELTAAS